MRLVKEYILPQVVTILLHLFHGFKDDYDQNYIILCKNRAHKSDDNKWNFLLNYSILILMLMMMIMMMIIIMIISLMNAQECYVVTRQTVILFSNSTVGFFNKLSFLFITMRQRRISNLCLKKKAQIAKSITPKYEIFAWSS